MNTQRRNKADPNRIRKVIDMELLIEEHGICNFLGMTLEALEFITKDRIAEDENFEDSQHHKNLEHQMNIIECAMSAVDLNTRYGNSEARKVSKERFKDNMKSIGMVV